MKVSQILADKGSDAWSIGPDATVFEALEVMAEKKIGALLVTESDRLVGILSERDYARKVVLLGRGSRKTPVSEIMSPDPCCIRPEQTVDEAVALMTDKRIRHGSAGNRFSAIRGLGLVSLAAEWHLGTLVLGQDPEQPPELR